MEYRTCKNGPAEKSGKMKIKGMRWVILSLIVLVTIINILDRGTLNYMWKDEVDKTSGMVVQQGIASELGIVAGDMTPGGKGTKIKRDFRVDKHIFHGGLWHKPVIVGCRL